MGKLPQQNMKNTNRVHNCWSVFYGWVALHRDQRQKQLEIRVVIKQIYQLRFMDF